MLQCSKCFSKPMHQELMMLTYEQVVAAQKAALDTAYGLTAKAFGAGEKLVELNIATAKASMGDAVAHSHALMGAKDPQEFVALQAAQMQPTAEKLQAYGRHVAEIVQSTTGEFTKTAEAQAAEAQKAFGSFVDSVGKNAPAGSEAAVAFMKNAMAAAQNASDSVQKAMKQAAAQAEGTYGQFAQQFATQTAAATATMSKATAKKR
jgi:phasin family protein